MEPPAGREGGEEGQGRPLPVLAQPEAAGEVGEALRERLAASLDNT
jgi:hypothetical protein